MIRPRVYLNNPFYRAREEGLYPPPRDPPQEHPTVDQQDNIDFQENQGPHALFAQKVQNPGVRGPIEEHVGMTPPTLSKLFGRFRQERTWIRRIRRSFTYRRP